MDTVKIINQHVGISMVKEETLDSGAFCREMKVKLLYKVAIVSMFEVENAKAKTETQQATFSWYKNLVSQLCHCLLVSPQS